MPPALQDSLSAECEPVCSFRMHWLDSLQIQLTDGNQVRKGDSWTRLSLDWGVLTTVPGK